MAAVREGIPFNDSVTAIAIGVVTDLGAREIITSSEAPIHLAVNTTETMPTKQPTNWETNTGISCRRMLLSCRYKGTPKATMAGLSQKSMMEALPAYVSYEIPVTFRKPIKANMANNMGFNTTQPVRACKRLARKYTPNVSAIRKKSLSKYSMSSYPLMHVPRDN